MKNHMRNALAATTAAFIVSTATGQTIVNFDDIDRFHKGTSSGSWTLGSSTSALLVGEGTTTNVFMVVATFDISSLSSEIASASTITFSVDYELVNNDGVDIEAIGFGKTSGTVVTSDATEAGASAGSIPASTFAASPTGGTATYDVTTIVQSATDDFIAFRLTSNITPPGPQTGNYVQFYNRNTIPADGARLAITAIPEPGTYALLAGCAGLALMVARRRKV